MSLVSRDELRDMIHRMVPRTAPVEAPKTEAERTTDFKLRQMAIEQLKNLNAGK